MKAYDKARDMREHFVRRDRKPIGTQAKKTAVTWHYNGPAVGGVERWTPQQHINWIKNIIIPNHISRIRADGVQYHAYVLPSGEFWQLRDFDAVLWSTGDWEGNGYSINIHVPIGGDQKPTRAQVAELHIQSDFLIKDFGMAGRHRVFGHQEWKGAATACPGPHLMAELKAYRAGSNQAQVYMVHFDRTRVREGPGITFPVALGGKAVLREGDTFLADKLVQGEQVGGDTRWVHRADGLGFVHASLVVKV